MKDADYNPQPISLADAQRIWTLQKQKTPLEQRDIDLLHQAAEWQMWVSHGIKLQNGNTKSKRNLVHSTLPQSPVGVH